MSQIVETVPFNYNELRTEIEQKFKDAGYDTSLGSNVSQLSNIMAYVASMLNVNTALNINETILSYATKRENALEVARNFSYEASKKRSFVYDVTITFDSGDKYLPKWTEFTANGKSYYMINDDITVTAQQKQRTYTIMLKEGTRYTYDDDPDSLMITTTKITENGQELDQYYIDVPYTNIEENGIEVYVSYFDEYGVYHDKTQFSKKDSVFIESSDTLQKQFIRIDNTEYQTPRIYFKYAGSGKGIPLGSDVYINLLESSGRDGELDTSKIEELKCPITGVNVNKIVLNSFGQDEETIESIKTNAPKVYNTSNRLITVNDYHAACNRDTRILDSIIWGGETEFPKSPGHIWFSFLPNIPNKKYTHDDLNLSYVREYSDYVYNYQLPSKDTSNEAELQKYTEHNYVPQQTIKSNTKDGAGKVLNPGVWDNIEGYNVPSLIYHHRNPLFCEFDYTIDVLKYMLYDNQPKIRQDIFDIINNSFTGTSDTVKYQSFGTEYFNASIVKRIDKRITDISGFKMKAESHIILNENTVINENEDPTCRDVYIPLSVPYENYFDDSGKLMYEQLPNIDTKDFMKYISGNAHVEADIFTDWSFVDKDDNQKLQALIIAPIKSRQKFKKELKDIDDGKVFQLAFRIYPDGFEESTENAKYTNTHVYQYAKEDEIIKERFEIPYDASGKNGWYINPEYPNRIYLGTDVQVTNGKILEIDHTGFCGFYYLFNNYIKEILIHLFVDTSVSGYRDEALSNDANDPDADYKNCYFYTTTDNYMYSNTNNYFYSEAKLKDVKNYAELTKFVPKGGMTYDFDRVYAPGTNEWNDPNSVMTGYSSSQDSSSSYSLDNKSRSYLYTNDSKNYYSYEPSYVTLNGYTLQSNAKSNIYTGPIVKEINKVMYKRSALKMDLFKNNRNLNLVYKSPNFRVIKNVIPRLRSVKFEKIDDQLNS